MTIEAGVHTCARCKKKNKEGEYFLFHPVQLFSLDRFCDECYNELQTEEKEKQKEKYISGEEIPEGTDEIICPYCGYEYSDSFECYEDYDALNCEECGRKFEYSREIEVTYSTSRIEGE